MSVETLCAICESRTAEHGCDRCGRMVCDVHYDTAAGLCAECLAETGGRPTGEEGSEQDRPDGVDEYEF